MHDQTEAIRRVEISQLNAHPGSREALEAKHGEVWDTQELQQDFAVKGFMAPYIVVERRCDHVVGSLRFQHDHRLYFNFMED